MCRLTQYIPPDQEGKVNTIKFNLWNRGIQELPKRVVGLVHEHGNGMIKRGACAPVSIHGHYTPLPSQSHVPGKPTCPATCALPLPFTSYHFRQTCIYTLLRPPPGLPNLPTHLESSLLHYHSGCGVGSINVVKSVCIL